MKDLTCLRSNSVLSIRWKQECVTCPCDAHHTTKIAQLIYYIPNTGVNISTNKCTSGVKGRPNAIYSLLQVAVALFEQIFNEKINKFFAVETDF